MDNDTSTSGGSYAGNVSMDGPRQRRPWQLRTGFWLFMAIGAYYLITEHRAHLALGLPYLPLLLFAACPLIHLFAHGGHGGHQAGPPRHWPDVQANRSGRQVETGHRHGGDLP